MQASIQSRLAGAMREQGMRSLLLADPENFGYVAGPMLPYVKQTPDRAVLALFEPGTDEAACTCWLYPDLAQPAEAQLAKEPSAASRKAAPIWTAWSALISARPPLPYSTPCARPSPAARSRMRAPCCAACAL